LPDPPNFYFGEITPIYIMAENNLQLLAAKRGFGKAGLRLAVAVVVSFGQSVKIRVNKLPRIRADESEEGNWTPSTQSSRGRRKCLYFIP